MLCSNGSPTHPEGGGAFLEKGALRLAPSHSAMMKLQQPGLLCWLTLPTPCLHMRPLNFIAFRVPVGHPRFPLVRGPLLEAAGGTTPVAWSQGGELTLV